VTDLLFTDHPPDRVHDIALTATVGAYDASDVVIEVDDCFISKTLKTLDF
jgi:hypothetical protein